MKRNLFTMILLMFFTFGIYTCYLIYKISNEVNDLINEDKNNALIDLLLSIFTGGLYTIYWVYKICKQLEEYESILMMRKSSNSILCIILSILLYPYGIIISIAIAQNEMNKILDEKITF